LETRRASRDLSLEALFRWMTFFLAALSSAAEACETAFLASSSLPDAASFLTCLVAFLIFSSEARFLTLRRIFCLAALMADLVLGIRYKC
jgi:hypothetical protein